MSSKTISTILGNCYVKRAASLPVGNREAASLRFGALTQEIGRFLRIESLFDVVLIEIIVESVAKLLRKRLKQ